ncbi:alpha/beta hydrolase [Nocardia cyriacigeorgica]|jgi:acetyl esterase|uniref:alpha/beta hydrolase n=1 Tax=Nocardia cyriacigeorgica TaxID=135487 RepID=UPI0005603DDF|nr:alpha/beta hydrolase [Nocardia cyriacigeorgica]AVH24100.1 alpha/beta hydrolase [Nocardia cyriacigeorgica]MBF6326355.1 alpha/beta hydrolase [Nocardia cyriacigeorgica]MBF6499171.1 alpha/beta hydrolase [Nocardia cyriacigeorgica]PPJ05552.1 alpha/beta hydrolase [Nocardia cyriacigeorgica]TLF59975.1 alpha/beta hydrolase [Nocardia cyriacigeorgica]
MRLRLDHLIDPHLRLLVDDSRAFYEHRAAGRGPTGFEELQAIRARAGAPAPVDPPAVDEVVVAEGREVPVRIHAPVGGAANGVFMEFHGGGFYMGSAAGSDARNRRMADALGVAVVSVDYRLAPENPWPAAPDDAETAALWLVEHAGQRFGTGKLAVGGFSAGSTLAMTTLLRLRDRGIDAFDCAVLQFGTYDLSAQTPPGRLIADEYFLEAYAGGAPDRTHPDISPIYADLSGLPPVLMVVGEHDILLQDNLTMAARLSAFEVDVDLRIYPGAPHGFTGHPTPMAKAALDDIETWLGGQLGTTS